LNRRSALLSPLRRLFHLEGQLFQNGVAQATQVLVGLLLIRQIILLLGPTRYGVLSFALLVLSFSSTLDGLRNLLAKHIHDHDSNTSLMPLLRSMERFNAVLSLLAALAAYLAIRILNPQGFEGTSGPLLAACVGLTVAQSPYCARLVSQNQTGLVALLRALYWLCVFFGFYALALWGQPASRFIHLLFAATLVLTLVYRAAGYRGISALGPLTQGGAALFLQLVGTGLLFNALSALLSFGDRLMLVRMGGALAFGRYAVAYDLGSKLTWFGFLVSASLFPAWSRLFSDGDHRGFRQRMARDLAWTGVLTVLLLVPLLAAATLIGHLWARGMTWDPQLVLTLRLVLLAAALQGVGSLAAYGLIASRRMATVLGAYALSAVLALTLGPLLVIRFGTVGAASTFLLSRSADILMLVALIHQRKHHPREREENNPCPPHESKGPKTVGDVSPDHEDEKDLKVDAHDEKRQAAKPVQSVLNPK
jgi:O-antigen/teichoic acid export membrane protein